MNNPERGAYRHLSAAQAQSHPSCHQNNPRAYGTFPRSRSPFSAHCHVTRHEGAGSKRIPPPVNFLIGRTENGYFWIPFPFPLSLSLPLPFPSVKDKRAGTKSQEAICATPCLGLCSSCKTAKGTTHETRQASGRGLLNAEHASHSPSISGSQHSIDESCVQQCQCPIADALTLISCGGSARRDCEQQIVQRTALDHLSQKCELASRPLRPRHKHSNMSPIGGTAVRQLKIVIIRILIVAIIFSEAGEGFEP